MRGFIGFLFVSIFFYFSSLAADDCSSIVDKKCEWEKALVISRDIEVKVSTFGKHTVDYSIIKNVNNISSNCPQGKCTCEESSGSVFFSGKPEGLPLINEQEKKRAENYRCSAAKAFARHIPQFVYASSRLVSVASYNLNYVRDVTKSCHGEHPFVTYDTQSGKEYLLKDIMLGNGELTLIDALVADFATRYGEQEGMDIDSIKQSVQKYLIENPPENSGFVVENGKIYTNIGSFVFGCSSGSFYPVEVPEYFINPEFLNKAKK